MSFANLNIKATSKFLKIESGKPQDLRLLQDSPMERILHGFGKEATDCLGDDCSLCAEGHEPQQRFSINVYVHGASKVMIWEFGSGIAKQLRSIAKSLEEESKDIVDVDLRVDSEGEMKAKKYKITPRMTSKPIPSGLVLYKLEGTIPF